MCRFLILILLAAIAFDSAVSDPNYDDTNALVDWIRSVCGSVDPRQTIHNEVPSAPASVRGVFADSDIASRYLLVDLMCNATLIYADEEEG